jgi:hypothetical protein
MQLDNLGGRLPLLDPAELSETQREVYDRANSTMVPWAEAAGHTLAAASSMPALGRIRLFTRSSPAAVAWVR